MGGRRGKLITSETRSQAVSLVKEACSQGARKHKACEQINISHRTIARWEKPDGTIDKRQCATRPSQPNQLSKEERQMILSIANSKRFCDLPPSKIVPLLADEGRYIASESTFYRVLRVEKQLKHRHRSRPSTHYKPKAHIASGPNQVWSWDISYLPTTVSGLYFYLYVILDVFSRKIVGWSIHDKQSAEYASSLIKQSCLDAGVSKNQLVLHSDNGKPMKGVTMITMLEKLGVLPSFSRPSVSDDNPYSESMFKTIKYHPTYPDARRFDTIRCARIWMEKFTGWYNTKHLHSGLKFVTPDQRHSGVATTILNSRAMVYKLAKKSRPKRWSGDTRDWSLPDSITLNPDKKGNLKGYEINSKPLVAV